MSHQPAMPPRQFSPQQHSPNGPYQLPPNKRAKLSPGPVSNPGSPSYSNYAPSPGATTPIPTPNHIPSPVPHPINNQVHPGTYNTPYQQTNGRAQSVGMSLTMPTPVSTTPIPSPQPPTPNASHPSYLNAKLAPVPSPAPTPIAPPAQPIITNMGPPALNPMVSFNDGSKPGSKAAAKSAETYDMNDMLLGTGIDLDEEAEYMNNLDNRGYPNYPPAGRDSFYGAGPANQPAQHTDAQTQEELAVETADRTWNEAAARLARTRSQEIGHFLLQPGTVHKRVQDVAQKFGLGLHLDLKPDTKTPYSGRMVNPVDFPKPEIKVISKPGPDGTMIQTLGSFIPTDSFLVDQLALLSISTKQHLRELLNDANKIATARQKTAHGVVPQEWEDAAAPKSTTANGVQPDGTRTGAESAVSPRTNPLKRPVDEISNGLPTPVSDVSPSNFMVEALAASGKDARNAEEARLRKRLKRLEKPTDSKEGGDSSRAGSVAPGTPGSIAPDSGEVKPPTKKESKKAAKLAEASSTTVNQTLGLFAGGKKKKYSWMTGGAASGTSTPRAQAGGAPGTPGAAATTSNKASRGPLTKAGVTQLGQFREDSDKGKNIQLRDWVVVLEERGFDQKSLQHIYEILDKSAKATVERSK
ncbi:uncharacterized protein F4822DRAFT_238645 [Hypoxylon trugodes]|uniref:uncharacterized protein n=1 Tax=Hypoxylon trugodes TaxID=326681 RepID=UPI00219D0206|nr:uncharacterized protein F4822DRAFT_238645 [Hypoxylon trugodes]KAI1388213.1 hypothetical protein F4822DRAFT_238645 [Hypoxylon trugodes]